MKWVIVLALLLSTPAFAQEDTTESTQFNIGVSGGINPISGRLSYTSDFGLLFLAPSGSATQVSLELGMIDTRVPHRANMPWHSSTLPGFRDSVIGEFHETLELPLGFGIGHFFTRSFGLYASGGVVISPRVTLSEGPFGLMTKSRRTPLLGMFAFEARYRTARQAQLRVGYNNRRGALLGYTVPLSFKIDTAALMLDTPIYRKLYVVGGYGLQQGISLGLSARINKSSSTSLFAYDPTSKEWSLTSSWRDLVLSTKEGVTPYLGFHFGLASRFDSPVQVASGFGLNVGVMPFGTEVVDLSIGSTLRLDPRITATGERIHKGLIQLQGQVLVGFGFFENRMW